MDSPHQDDQRLLRLRTLEEEFATLKAECSDLEVARTRWQLLFEQSPFGIVIYHPDGRVKSSNTTMKRLFSLSDDDYEKLLDRYNILEDPQLEKRGTAELVRKAFAGQPAVISRIPYEVPATRERPVSTKWLEGVIYPIHGPDGGLLEVVLIQVAVTSLVIAREDLGRSRDLLDQRLSELEHLYASAPVGLCMMDTGLRFARINEQLAAINGRPVAEHLGKTLREVLPEIADDIEPVYRRVIETGEMTGL